MSEHSKPHLVLIKPQGLHKLVVEQIQQMIIEGALAPGTRLNERLLCEKLGVSRTPLREALKILAALGLVELLPNRGAAVVQLTAKDIAETFEVISHLEAMAGELACARITDAEINEIRALHFEMLACHARRDLPAYYRTNQRFSSNLDRERWDAAVREHSMMIEALEARDGARLSSILESHLLAKRDAALAAAAAVDEKLGTAAKS
jgi:DNA-binding GntR family transcriptional regulator